MNCSDAAERITALVDGELPPAERAEVERHLEGCAACRDARSAEEAVAARLRAVPRPAPPPVLAASVMERIAAAPPPAAVRPAGRLLPLWPFFVAGAVAAASLLAMVMVGTGAREGTPFAGGTPHAERSSPLPEGPPETDPASDAGAGVPAALAAPVEEADEAGRLEAGVLKPDAGAPPRDRSSASSGPEEKALPGAPAPKARLPAPAPAPAPSPPPPVTASTSADAAPVAPPPAEPSANGDIGEDRDASGSRAGPRASPRGGDAKSAAGRKKADGLAAGGEERDGKDAPVDKEAGKRDDDSYDAADERTRMRDAGRQAVFYRADDLARGQRSVESVLFALKDFPHTREPWVRASDLDTSYGRLRRAVEEARSGSFETAAGTPLPGEKVLQIRMKAKDVERLRNALTKDPALTETHFKVLPDMEVEAPAELLDALRRTVPEAAKGKSEERAGGVVPGAPGAAGAGSGAAPGGGAPPPPDPGEPVPPPFPSREQLKKMAAPPTKEQPPASGGKADAAGEILLEIHVFENPVR